MIACFFYTPKIVLGKKRGKQQEIVVNKTQRGKKKVKGQVAIVHLYKIIRYTKIHIGNNRNGDSDIGLVVVS